MINKDFKKPNVKGPRFRPEVFQVMNKDLFNKFKEKHPKYKDLDNSTLRKIGKKFNILFWETVIDSRDGVQLPEGLGYIFIGTCQKSKNKKNIDFANSKKYGQLITQNNWGTDGKLAKIFYTNYANKYRFVNRECWRFEACRNFKRNVAKTYPENWPMYIEVDPMKKIRKIFQKDTARHALINKQSNDLENYNELDI
jgi:hypothetical protein